MALTRYFGTRPWRSWWWRRISGRWQAALFMIGLNAFGSLRSRALTGYLAEGCAAPTRSCSALEQLADVQAFSQHVVDSLTSGLATTDMPAGADLNRAAEPSRASTPGEAIGAATLGLQLPVALDGLFGPPERRPQQPRVDLWLYPARRPAD